MPLIKVRCAMIMEPAASLQSDSYVTKPLLLFAGSKAYRGTMELPCSS
jgi:hypothetical protein